MRILMLTRYGRRGANSRYRLWQYQPCWERAGDQVEVRPMLDDEYLEKLYSGGKRRAGCIVSAYIRRLADLRSIRGADVVICDQELLPYFPPGIEVFLARRSTCFIVDYDDAAYFKYERLPLLRRRIPAIMSVADAVVAGNRNLAEYSQRFNRNVHLIPTVVNVHQYTPKLGHGGKSVTLVWIGTPITAMLLRPLLPVMAELKRRHPDLRFCFIGAGAGVDAQGIGAEIVPWSEASEASCIAKCDIGIMPLHDDEFTRAKCGLKLIQYMAAGLPVVASPVGANCDIVDDGSTGFLAATQAEWLSRLELLVNSAELRRRLGQCGRDKAVAEYSLERGFHGWQSVIESALSSRKPLPRGARAI